MSWLYYVRIRICTRLANTGPSKITDIHRLIDPIYY